MRHAPPALRGIKTNREPWAKDSKIYKESLDGHGLEGEGRARSQRTATRSPSPQQLEKKYREEHHNWIKRTQWNSTPFRNAPDQLRGIKPVTREPWFEDMAIYNAKFSNHEIDEKGGYVDGTFGARKNQRALTEEEGEWDSTTWRYVPHALKGIKPVTNEPWARDEAVYNESRNSVDTRDSEDFVPTQHFNFLRESRDAGPQWDAGAAPPKGAMRVYPA